MSLQWHPKFPDGHEPRAFNTGAISLGRSLCCSTSVCSGGVLDGFDSVRIFFAVVNKKVIA